MRDLTTFVRELVKIPSVNPMGKDREGDIIYEHRITRYLKTVFGELNVEHRELPVETIGDVTRSNLVALIPGRPDPATAPTIMLQAHQDTVPIDGMTIDPFAADLRDARIYGRGACDIKGALGTILSVAQRLVQDQPAEHANLVLAFTMNEECGFTGAQAMSEQICSNSLLGCDQAPDAIIVSEPTSLNVVTGHKGVVRWRCRTRGVAGHSSAPDDGVNAIYAMSRLVQALNAYHREHLTLQMQQPTLGGPTLSVGTIQGGISVNTIPDECVIEIDRRTLPTEDPLMARQAIIDQLKRVDIGRAEVIHDDPFMKSPGFADQHNQAFAEQLCAVVQSHGHDSQIIGAPYGTDAAELSRCGAPTVVFGPGHIAQAHTEDEWVEITQLQAAERILWDLLTAGSTAR